MLFSQASKSGVEQYVDPHVSIFGHDGWREVVVGAPLVGNEEQLIVFHFVDCSSQSTDLSFIGSVAHRLRCDFFFVSLVSYSSRVPRVWILLAVGGLFFRSVSDWRRLPILGSASVSRG